MELIPRYVTRFKTQDQQDLRKYWSGTRHVCVF